SCTENDVTIVSVFVNPTQFGPAEDFAAYPRDLERDAAIAEGHGVDLIFAPEPREMYAPDASTTVTVAGVSERLCGEFRPGHFVGVATVVCKLLNIVQPDRAYFGQKDYQQLQVIRRMVRDLDIPVDVVPVPTFREPDGLALSSRNAYLSPDERRVAPRLYEALQAGAQVARAGGTGAEAVAAVRALLDTEPLLGVQYLVAVDPDTLRDKSDEGCPLVLAAATHLGRTRLIDNIIINGESE
ncbi:MAG: pantoate--beta-alanine ligase, partial [Armatimonadetes bacterium]|nr:pantoate--beta-alanine ligase [Armatimonadota bacterium]